MSYYKLLIDNAGHYLLIDGQSHGLVLGVAPYYDPWISDNKDLGPWEFSEQGNKYGYVNNPNWSDDQDAIKFCEDMGLSLNSENRHRPCGYWHKDTENTEPQVWPFKGEPNWKT